MAQNAGDNSFYFVTYYANNVSGAPDNTIRLINDGDLGVTMYAAIIVFDDSQEAQACGICTITPDGILSEDVKTQLTNNPLTGRIPSRGVIKIGSLVPESSLPSGVKPDVASQTVNLCPSGTCYFEPGLRGWATHVQRATPTSGAYVTTEAPLADSNLTQQESDNLYNLCYYIQLLGSGQGTISCTPEDHDF